MTEPKPQSRCVPEIGPGFTPEQEAEIRERHRTDTELFSNLIACAHDGRFSNEYIGNLTRAYLGELETALKRLREHASEIRPIFREDDEPLREMMIDYRNAHPLHAEGCFQRVVQWIKTGRND